MAFRIPNLPDATRASQAEPDSGDFEILAAGIGGTGVESGCDVTTTGAANGSVLVAAGQMLVNDIYRAVTSGTLALPSNSSGNPRFDLITVDATAVKAVVVGTPGAVPVFPTIPADRVVLASVYVPNGHTSGSTVPAGDIVDKRVSRSSSDFNSHNVLKYGAVGNSHHLTGGGADDTQAFQDAYDAAQASGGYGIVMIPGGRSYRITDSIYSVPNPSLAPVWTWGVGAFGGTRVVGLPNIVWDGATDGNMYETLASGQNLPSALFRNVRFAGRNIAGSAIHFGPSNPGDVANTAKLDTGTGLDEVWVASTRGNGIHVDGSGATNFWIRGGRWDAIGGYAFYMKTTSHTHLSIRDVTWDCQNPPSGTTPKGFMHLDGSAMESNAYCFVHLDTIHTETQVDLFESDATGTNPADRRGVYAFTVNPSQQRCQFRVIADAIQATGHTSTRASHSVFQMLGGTEVQRTARAMFHIRGLGPVGGTVQANALGYVEPIGNITNSKKPSTITGITTGVWAEIKYAPGGDNVLASEKPGIVSVTA